MSDQEYRNYPYTENWLDEPDFDNPTKVHDWRNHVGERTKALWSSFTTEQKLAIAKDADDSASNEEWD